MGVDLHASGIPLGVVMGVAFLLSGPCRLLADSVVMIGGDQTGFPAEVNDIVAMSAGSHHALALRENGSVLAWGSGGDDGRLTIPSDLGSAIAVAAGKANGAESHSVAVRADGTVVCWGGNSQGQCEVPEGLTGVVAVVAGSTHTVALKSDRTVVSWGGPDAMHEVMAGWTDIVRVSADALGTAGLKSDGTVVLCDSDGTPHAPAIENVAMIALIYDQFGLRLHRLMAVQADGTQVLWSRNPQTSPKVTPPGSLPIAAVASNSRTEYLLMADHTVRTSRETAPLHRGLHMTDIAAGDDFQLIQYVRPAPEISMVGEREIPIIAQGLWIEDLLFVEGAPAPFEASARVRLRNSISEAVTVTELSSDSAEFVLDLPPLPIVLAPGGSVDVPVTVAVPTPGTRRGLLRIASSDPLFAERQLPIFAHGYPPHPRPGSIVSLWGNAPLWGSGEITDAVAVAAGTGHALALRADGTVVGRSGDSTGSNDVPAGLRPAVKIAAGDDITAAIHRDGTVTVWGGSPILSQPTLRTPYGVVGVAAGIMDTHVWASSPARLALKADGTVTSLFRSVHDPPNSLWLLPASLLEADVKDVIQIAAGRVNVLLLKRDGTVQGFANSSQLPFGNDAEPPEDLANVIAVAGGGALPHHGPQFNFQIALKGDGNVVTWGAPLGLPDDLTDVVDVAAGGRKALFLRGNGTLVRYSPSVSLEWNLPPGIRDVSAIAVGGYHVLAIAPPMPEWYTPFRIWMQERGWTAWAEDPDQNGSNHWEDWVFARDLGTHQTLDAFLGSYTYLPISFFPVVRLLWRSQAPKPIVLRSADLRTWGETEMYTHTTYFGQPPPPDLFWKEYYHVPMPTSSSPVSEYFRVLPP